jgi:DNA-binding CsgD family transcriptional regulator
MYMQPFTVHVLIDMGRLAEARVALDTARETLRIGDSARLFLEAEARVLQAEGRAEEALAVLDVAEPQMLVVRNPVWRPWRQNRASVLHDLGRDEEALALMAEELVLAEEWGSPGLVGRCWRVRGEIEGADGEQSLRTALELLGDSPLGLDVAKARAALGRLLAARDPASSEACELLAAALSLADECDADGLWREVATQLRALGVDVPVQREASSRLTATERRIAAMTAQGMHEQEIAQALFVTASTVNGIVDSVMQRLGVTSVDELRRVLALA